ncbi:MAG TPA: dienelactone hydrolase family protein [Gemmatimonadota bacterium]|jgi:carboxymethylenebutenolidase|nr:dienelactone hydrolase family protein [Gemmatimonadota bacterium]
MSLRPILSRFPVVMLALALGLLAGCADTDAQSEASEGSAAPDAAATTSPDSVPAAILGQAPPPRGEDVHYVTGDTATTGYLAVPEGAGPFPAVILIHEWDGLNDRVRQVADAFADEGYVALAADLFSGRTGANREENMALVQEAHANMPAVIANLDAAAGYLRARDGVTGKVAAMGWCFGGGVALSYALGGEHHDGTAIFYGSLVTDPDSLAALDHPIYGTFAGQDDGIPPSDVARFVDALREAGVENDVHVYDPVEHGFWLWVDRDPETNLAPAADAWRRLEAYLERTIG